MFVVVYFGSLLGDRGKDVESINTNPGHVVKNDLYLTTFSKRAINAKGAANEQKTHTNIVINT